MSHSPKVITRICCLRLIYVKHSKNSFALERTNKATHKQNFYHIETNLAVKYCLFDIRTKKKLFKFEKHKNNALKH